MARTTDAERDEAAAASIAEADGELNALNARYAEAEEVRSVVESTGTLWVGANSEDEKAMAKRVASVFGCSLIVSIDRTLEKELIGNVTLARIVVRSRVRQKFS